MAENEIILADGSDDSPHGPEHDHHAEGGDSGAGGQRGRPQAELPTRDGCLRTLNSLQGLVALKIVKPAEANSIRSINDSILRQLHQSPSSPSSLVSDQNLVAILRAQPELLRFIEPLLTYEQVEMLMREVTDDAKQT